MNTPLPFAKTDPAFPAVSSPEGPPSSGRYSYVAADTIPAAASRDEEALLARLKGHKWGAPKGLKLVRAPREEEGEEK